MIFIRSSSVEHHACSCPIGWGRSSGEVVKGSGGSRGRTSWMADVPEEHDACN